MEQIITLNDSPAVACTSLTYCPDLAGRLGTGDDRRTHCCHELHLFGGDL